MSTDKKVRRPDNRRQQSRPLSQLIAQRPSNLRKKTFTAFFHKYRGILRDTEEKKPSALQKANQESMLEVMGSLLDPNVKYRFRLAASAPIALAANGSGVVNTYESADPSGGSGSSWTASEWSALLQLFATVRCVSFQVKITAGSNYSTTSTGNTPILAISSYLGGINAVPGSFAIVNDNPDSQIYNFEGLQQPTIVHEFKHDLNTLQFSAVGSPNPGTYAGCPGTILIYGINMAASVTVGQIVNYGIYEFSARV